MKKVATIIAFLLSVTAFSQTNYNVEKDKFVLDQLAQKPVSSSKINSKDGITTFYELVYKEIKIQVEISPGAPTEKKRNVVMTIINIKDGKEIVNNHPLTDKFNKVSQTTIQKIREQFKLIK